MSFWIGEIYRRWSFHGEWFRNRWGWFQQCRDHSGWHSRTWASMGLGSQNHGRSQKITTLISSHFSWDSNRTPNNLSISCIFSCTQIMWSVSSTHRNPKYFHDPEKFDPSRFEGAGPAPFTFVPFGGGPRMCPGNEFARMEILAILHRLVTQFSWVLDDPNEAVVLDPLAFPVKGLPILLNPRVPSHEKWSPNNYNNNMGSILISNHTSCIPIFIVWCFGNLVSHSQDIFPCVEKIVVTKVAKEKTELPPYLYSSLFIVMNIIYLHSFNEHKWPDSGALPIKIRRWICQTR